MRGPQRARVYDLRRGVHGDGRGATGRKLAAAAGAPTPDEHCDTITVYVDGCAAFYARCWQPLTHAGCRAGFPLSTGGSERPCYLASFD